ncbi:MAG TPA: hypothetical protein VG456_19150 [Candidatus Sulfopaludibacter sp.]|jgi:homoserine O-acetyltransferase|nr:hypothetical protein [Candidatus Sulfopaludibacter sp.]
MRTSPASWLPGRLRDTILPIPSLRGNTAGAASNPADAKFLNQSIARFLATR